MNVTVQDVLSGFRQYAIIRGVAVDQLSATQSIDLMVSFYREVRVDGCDFDNDGDMLLFQWGSYDWGEGESFHYNITRQLILTPDDDQDLDSFLGQLSLTLKYEPVTALKTIVAGNRWCQHPGELADFITFAQDCEATAVVRQMSPSAIRLSYENAE